MVKKFFLVGAMLLAGSSVSLADLVANWNFNTLSITTAGTPGSSPSIPTSIAASTGTGTLSLSGFNGLIDDFGGSTINAVGGDPAEESLSLIAGGASAPFPGNGGFITFNTSLTGFENPVITFATRGTSTGFNSGLWSYSTDGTIFTSAGLPSTATTSTSFALATADFSAISILDNAPSVFFRYTLSGATNSSGNNRIDNLQINAGLITAVPEPTSIFGAMALGMAGVVQYRRRRRTVS